MVIFNSILPAGAPKVSRQFLDMLETFVGTFRFHLLHRRLQKHLFPVYFVWALEMKELNYCSYYYSQTLIIRVTEKFLRAEIGSKFKSFTFVETFFYYL